jgi:hypothetical protein
MSNLELPEELDIFNINIEDYSDFEHSDSEFTIEEFKRLYAESSQRPFEIGEVWLYELNFKDIQSLMDEGYKLTLDKAAGYLNEDHLLYDCGSDKSTIVIAKLIPFTDEVISIHRDINPEAVEILKNRDIKFKFESSNSLNNLSSCINYVLNSREYGQECKWKPTFRGMPKVLTLSLIMTLMKLNFSIEGIKWKYDGEWEWDNDGEDIERVKYITLGENQVPLAIENSNSSCNQLLEKLNKEVNRDKPFVICGTGYVDPVDELLKQCIVAIEQNSEFDKTHLPMILNLVKCNKIEAIQLLLFLGIKRLVNLYECRGVNEQMDRLLDLLPKPMKNSRSRIN